MLEVILHLVVLAASVLYLQKRISRWLESLNFEAPNKPPEPVVPAPAPPPIHLPVEDQDGEDQIIQDGEKKEDEEKVEEVEEEVTKTRSEEIDEMLKHESGLKAHIYRQTHLSASTLSKLENVLLFSMFIIMLYFTWPMVTNYLDPPGPSRNVTGAYIMYRGKEQFFPYCHSGRPKTLNYRDKEWLCLIDPDSKYYVDPTFKRYEKLQKPKVNPSFEHPHVDFLVLDVNKTLYYRVVTFTPPQRQLLLNEHDLIKALATPPGLASECICPSHLDFFDSGIHITNDRSFCPDDHALPVNGSSLRLLVQTRLHRYHALEGNTIETNIHYDSNPPRFPATADHRLSPNESVHLVTHYDLAYVQCLNARSVTEKVKPNGDWFLTNDIALAIQLPPPVSITSRQRSHTCVIYCKQLEDRVRGYELTT